QDSISIEVTQSPAPNADIRVANRIVEGPVAAPEEHIQVARVGRDIIDYRSNHDVQFPVTVDIPNHDLAAFFSNRVRYCIERNARSESAIAPAQENHGSTFPGGRDDVQVSITIQVRDGRKGERVQAEVRRLLESSIAFSKQQDQIDAVVVHQQIQISILVEVGQQKISWAVCNRQYINLGLAAETLVWVLQVNRCQ